MDTKRPSEQNHTRQWVPWGLAFLGLLIPLLMGLFRAERWPLSGDESLYAFWARHWLENRDPLFLASLIDKPPIYIWLQSLSLYVFGPKTAAARYVNILAVSFFCLGMGYFSWRQWGWRSAFLCFALATANPLILAFGPTGLTDPIFVLAGFAACLSARLRRYWASGALLAFSIFCKQAGLLILPLALGTFWLYRSENWRQDARQWLTGLSFVSIPIVIWDGIRMVWVPSFWATGFAHYAPMQLTPLRDLGPRLEAWLPLYSALFGSWLGLAAWGILLTAAAWTKGRNHFNREDCWIGLSIIWGGGYALLHCLMTFNPWIRYLLPLVPVLVLSTGWSLHVLWPAAKLSPWLRLSLGLLFLALVFSLAAGWEDGWKGTLPEMQDNAGLAGLPEVLDLLKAHAPSNSLVMHRELSWHFLFYLFDNPRLIRVWFANAGHLVELVKAQPPEVPIVYLRLDRDASQTAELSAALKQAGYASLLCAQAEKTKIFEIRPVPATSCQHIQIP